MALTWVTIIGGVAVLFGLPLAVIFLNARKPRAGWWLLAAVAGFVILGNAVENALAGSSALL